MKVAWFPGPPGRGLGRGRQHGLRRRGQGQRHRDRRHQVRRHRQGGAAEAGRGRARGPSGHQLHRRHVADRRGGRAGCSATAGLRTRSRSWPTTSPPASTRASRRGQILAAPTDSAVIQGRIAIDQAVRILEGKDYVKHVGPALYVIDANNIEHVRLSVLARARRLQADLHGRLTAAESQRMNAAAPDHAAASVDGSPDAAELLGLTGITKRFPGVDALVDVDFRPSGG